MKSKHKIRVLMIFALALYLSGCVFDTGDSGDGDPAIEGYVRDEVGRPVADVKIKAYISYGEALVSSSTCSTWTDSRGFYRVPFGPSVIEIMVRPSKAGCVFRPPQISYYSPDGALRGENFTAACGTLHSISGSVFDTEGDPVTGVAITIRDELNRWDKTVFTNQSGLYCIENIVPGLDYVVTPFLSSRDFDPPRRAYENLGRDFEDQDFIALPPGIGIRPFSPSS